MNDKQAYLESFDDEKLIDIVKNYRQYGYDGRLRARALALLEKRGIDKEQLVLTGNFDNSAYDSALGIYASFDRNSKRALVLYILLFVTLLVPMLLSGESPLADATTVIVIICLGALYFFFLLRSFFNQYQFYGVTGQKYGADGALSYVLLGMPFYVLMFFYYRGRMKEQMRYIR